MSDKQKLRIITYMTANFPVALYQLFQHYLEEALNVKAYLMVESRWNGPNEEGVDPFTADEVDLGFISSTSYLGCYKNDRYQLELLPVAPIYVHPRSNLRPVYFSEVIVSSENKSKFKEFIDLKGHVWGYNDMHSISGTAAPLAELRRMGTNATFFGNIVQTGSYLKSIDAVLSGGVEAAAVNSTVLELRLRDHPEYRPKLEVLCSLGPLPVAPIVVNKRMPDALRKRIAEALLKMNTIDKWKTQLEEFTVWGFKPIDHGLYDNEVALRNVVKDLSLKAAYY